MNRSALKSLTSSPALRWNGAAALAAAATAGWVARRARRAEHDHPPQGHLLDVGGVVLHAIERGQGLPVVLIHGNAVTHRDFDACGLIDRLARQHRVIAFDRPGYGHSSRPRDRLWTPAAQANAIHDALLQLGVEKAVVIGHSMGAMVAMAHALEYPNDVSRLVLLGGYYYPSVRVDALLTAPVALPVLGDVMRYTVTAVSARLLLGRMVRAMFAPLAVPSRFLPIVSREMMVRPIQLRANAEDAAFMVGQAKASSQRHHELCMPVAILAGGEDRIVDPQAHSVRLHDEVPGSSLAIIAGAGHMVHYAAPDEIVAAVDGFELPRVAPAEQAA